MNKKSVELERCCNSLENQLKKVLADQKTISENHD